MFNLVVFASGGGTTLQAIINAIQNQGLEAFDDEMRKAGLDERMIELMHKHCDRYWGCCAI